MKKTKLIMSIITCCFALSVLAFGVYASLSVSFNLSGKISFDPHGVDATITTQVFKYEENITQDDAYLKASELQGKNFETLESSYEKLTEKQVFNTKVENTYYPNLEQDLSESVLNFEDCKAYFIVVHVLPSESYSLEEHNQIVFVELTQQDLSDDNVWLAYNDKYLAIYPSAQETGFNMVFFIGITEPYTAVPEDEFSLNLSFEYKDIYVISGEDSCGYGSLILGKTIQDIVLPEMYNGQVLHSFTDYRACHTGQIIMSKNIDYYFTVKSGVLFEAIVAQDNEIYSSLDGALYDKTKDILIKNKYDRVTETVNVHGFVKQIDNINLNSITKTVDLSKCEDLTHIPSFSNYSSLTNLLIPNGVTSISDDAFDGCDNLHYNIDEHGGKYLGNINNLYVAFIGLDETHYSSFMLNSNCKVIYGGACSGSNISFFDFNGADIKEIPTEMFYECTSLIHTSLPDGITKIGRHAFYNCRLISGIKLPESVTSIGNGAFSYCNNVYKIDETYGGKYVPSTSNDYFALVGIDDTQATTTDFVLNSNCKIFSDNACQYLDITSFDFNCADIKEIPERMFDECRSLTKVIMSDNVTIIKSTAFTQCSALENITMSNNLTSIENGAFSSCSSLTSIIIPDGVTSIGGGAFSSTNLSTIYIPASVQFIEYGAFYNIFDKNFKIYCEIQKENVPTGWQSGWDNGYYDEDNSFDTKWPVEWNVTRDEYNAKFNG